MGAVLPGFVGGVGMVGAAAAGAEEVGENTAAEVGTTTDELVEGIARLADGIGELMGGIPGLMFPGLVAFVDGIGMADGTTGFAFPELEASEGLGEAIIGAGGDIGGAGRGA